MEYYVDFSKPSIKNALRFIKDELTLALARNPDPFLFKTLEDIPLFYYIPALTLEEKEERAEIINKYKHAQPHQIEYYLLYHWCDEFAVLLWSILKTNGVKTKIVSQKSPFRHTYLIDSEDKIHDILLTYTNIVYPYDITISECFNTPRDFYANVFMIPNDLRDWEEKLLTKLDEIDHPPHGE